MINKLVSFGALILVGVFSSSLQAEPQSYIAYQAHYITPDSKRPGDDGFGGSFLYGNPISENFSLEAKLGVTSYQFNQRSRSQFVSGGLGLLRAFRGDPFEDDDVSPFVMAGIGAAYDDLPQASSLFPYAELGFGIFVPFIGETSRVRLEARYRYSAGDDAGVKSGLTTADNFGEAIYSIGIQFDLGQRVNVRSCASCDSDFDGVVDREDSCPESALNAPVAIDGCSADSDLDGVDNLLDQCPYTPDGSTVDEWGC